MNETLTEEAKKDDVAQETSNRYVKTEEAQKAQNEANQFYANLKDEKITNEQEEKAEIKADDYLNRFKEAINAEDFDALTKLLPVMTNKGRNLIGADEQLVKTIKDLKNVSVRNTVLDAIYPGIVNTDLFRDVIKARFNVSVGVDKLTKEDTPKEGYREEQYEWYYSYLYEDFIKKNYDEKTAREYADKFASQWANDDVEKWVEKMQEKYANKNKDWPKDALVHLYNSYLKIPQAQLDLLKAVTTKKSEGYRGAGGAASKNIYYIYYNNETVDQDIEGDANVGRVTDSSLHEASNKDKDGNYIIPLDSSEGLLSMDATIIHELGHVVDFTEKNGKYNPSAKYSSRKDFRALSGWIDHGKNPTDVVNAVEESLDTPYEKLPSADSALVHSEETDQAIKLNAEEIKLAKLIGERMIQTNAYKTPFVKDIVTKAVSEKCGVNESEIGIIGENDAIAIEKGATKDENDNIAYERDAEQSKAEINKTELRSAKSLAESMLNVGLIGHIQRGLSDSDPYFHERFTGMKRQIHQGYRGDNWFSYENAAWDNGKISMYQFREPCEEFAELYSSYHTAAIKGSYTPPKLKTWFESVGLNKGLPESMEKEDKKEEKQEDKKE